MKISKAVAWNSSLSELKRTKTLENWVRLSRETSLLASWQLTGVSRSQCLLLRTSLRQPRSLYCIETYVDWNRAIAMCLKNFKNSDRFHDKDVRASFSLSVCLSLCQTQAFYRLMEKWNFRVICQVFCRAISHRCLSQMFNAFWGTLKWPCHESHSAF